VRTIPSRNKSVPADRETDIVVRLFGRAGTRPYPRFTLAFFVVHQVEGLRDAEIGHFHVTFQSDHDILEADGTVDDVEVAAFPIAPGMSVGQPLRDLRHDEDGEIPGTGLPSLRCCSMNCSRFTPRTNSVTIKYCPPTWPR